MLGQCEHLQTSRHKGNSLVTWYSKRMRTSASAPISSSSGGMKLDFTYKNCEHDHWLSPLFDKFMSITESLRSAPPRVDGHNGDVGVHEG